MNQLRDNNKLMVERIWTIRTIRTTTITTTPAKRLNDMDMNDMVRYGMNHTNDNRITSTPDARHIWYIAYYYIETIQTFSPTSAIGCRNISSNKVGYLHIVFSCLCANSTTTFVHEDDLTTSINNAMALLFSWTLNQSTQALVMPSFVSGPHLFVLWTYDVHKKYLVCTWERWYRSL